MDHDHDHDQDPEGDADADADTRLYCYCQKQSYGEMIGCDDDGCQFEWFHLSCLLLDRPPEGTWLCPDCAVRAESKKKRGGGGKGGGGGRKGK
ncbi:hypothetical protein FFLO_04707 [Filobasidium floriforme]|uniref:PHD-type domain-containing protein n=1 Tax=Filobasidium floriforme TaxID=5210 RepID=A0A8K0JIE0_9TREE|nr:hypothetical protein FFLO_04707 [Filobasidium floriforme]